MKYKILDQRKSIINLIVFTELLPWKIMDMMVIVIMMMPMFVEMWMISMRSTLFGGNYQGFWCHASSACSHYSFKTREKSKQRRRSIRHIRNEMTDEKMIDINGTKRDTCETSFLTSVQVSLIGSLLRFLVFACLLHRLGFLRQDLAQKERREQMAPLSFTPVRTPSISTQWAAKRCFWGGVWHSPKKSKRTRQRSWLLLLMSPPRVLGEIMKNMRAMHVVVKLCY